MAWIIQQQAAGENENQRVYNGTAFTLNQYPFFVRVYGDGYCSGAFIAVNWILSAAHCTRKGRMQIESAYFSWLSVEGKNLSNHSQFEFSGIGPYADLVLAKINVSVDQSVPLSLPLPGEDNAHIGTGRPLTIYGAGRVALAPPQKHGLAFLCEIVTQPCIHTKDRHVIAGCICTKYYPPVRNTGCKGDSGGPLVARSRGRGTVIGVVSGGNAACQTGSESLLGVTVSYYIRVANFMPWILDTIDRELASHDLTLIMDMWMVSTNFLWPELT